MLMHKFIPIKFSRCILDTSILQSIEITESIGGDNLEFHFPSKNLQIEKVFVVDLESCEKFKKDDLYNWRYVLTEKSFFEKSLNPKFIFQILDLEKFLSKLTENMKSNDFLDEISKEETILDFDFFKNFYENFRDESKANEGVESYTIDKKKLEQTIISSLKREYTNIYISKIGMNFFQKIWDIIKPVDDDGINNEFSEKINTIYEQSKKIIKDTLKLKIDNIDKDNFLNDFLKDNFYDQKEDISKIKKCFRDNKEEFHSHIGSDYYEFIKMYFSYEKERVEEYLRIFSECANMIKCYIENIQKARQSETSKNSNNDPYSLKADYLIESLKEGTPAFVKYVEILYDKKEKIEKILKKAQIITDYTFTNQTFQIQSTLLSENEKRILIYTNKGVFICNRKSKVSNESTTFTEEQDIDDNNDGDDIFKDLNAICYEEEQKLIDEEGEIINEVDNIDSHQNRAQVSNNNETEDNSQSNGVDSRTNQSNLDYLNPHTSFEDENENTFTDETTNLNNHELGGSVENQREVSSDSPVVNSPVVSQLEINSQGQTNNQEDNKPKNSLHSEELNITGSANETHFDSEDRNIEVERTEVENDDRDPKTNGYNTEHTVDDRLDMKPPEIIEELADNKQTNPDNDELNFETNFISDDIVKDSNGNTLDSTHMNANKNNSDEESKKINHKKTEPLNKKEFPNIPDEEPKKNIEKKSKPDNKSESTKKEEEKKDEGSSMQSIIIKIAMSAIIIGLIIISKYY